MISFLKRLMVLLAVITVFFALSCPSCRTIPRPKHNSSTEPAKQKPMNCLWKVTDEQGNTCYIMAMINCYSKDWPETLDKNIKQAIIDSDIIANTYSDYKNLTDAEKEYISNFLNNTGGKELKNHLTESEYRKLREYFSDVSDDDFQSITKRIPVQINRDLITSFINKSGML